MSFVPYVSLTSAFYAWVWGLGHGGCCPFGIVSFGFFSAGVLSIGVRPCNERRTRRGEKSDGIGDVQHSASPTLIPRLALIGKLRNRFESHQRGVLECVMIDSRLSSTTALFLGIYGDARQIPTHFSE